MTVDSLIKSIVSSMTANNETYTFHNSSKDIQNVTADDDTLPVVYLDSPLKYKPEITQAGHYKQTFYCIVLFLFKDEFDNTEDQRQTIFEKARAAQREFHLLLDNDTTNINDLKVDTCPEIEHLFDAHVSGVMMPFSFELRNNDGVCI